MAALAVAVPVRLPAAERTPVTSMESREWTFDIPALPLHDALDRYTALTGLSVLYVADSARARRASAVQGRYTASQALTRLLSGSGMMVRYETDSVVSLVPVPVVSAARAETPPAVSATATPAQRSRYHSRLQAGVLRMLCDDPRIEPGRYRLVLQFRVTQARAIDIEQVVATQRPDQEALVRAVLTGQQVEAPPAGLGQPITMLLTPRLGGRQEVCAS